MLINRSTARSHIDVLEWPVPPIWPAKWSEFTEGEVRSFIDYINHKQPSGVVIPEVKSRIRMAAMRFYPGGYLVEGAIKWSPKQTAMFRLVWINGGSDDGLHFLTGRNPMFPISMGGLDLSPSLSADEPEVVDDWLRFFCSTVRGELGPFDLVEDVEALEFVAGVSVETQTEIQKTSAKLRRIRQDKAKPGYRRTALVRYGRSLFTAKFQIFPDGTVRMVDDRLIAENVLTQRSTWQRVWQFVESENPSVDPEVQL